MFLNKIRSIFCVPDTKFVSATNVARGQTRKLCVGNNVSSFARAFSNDDGDGGDDDGVKNDFIFYLRMSQFYRSKNLLKLNMHRQRSIPKEETKN